MALGEGALSRVVSFCRKMFRGSSGGTLSLGCTGVLSATGSGAATSSGGLLCGSTLTCGSGGAGLGGGSGVGGSWSGSGGGGCGSASGGPGGGSEDGEGGGSAPPLPTGKAVSVTRIISCGAGSTLFSGNNVNSAAWMLRLSSSASRKRLNCLCPLAGPRPRTRAPRSALPDGAGGPSIPPRRRNARPCRLR